MNEPRETFTPIGKPDGDYPFGSMVLVVKDERVIGYRTPDDKLGIFPPYMETNAPPPVFVGVDPALPGSDLTMMLVMGEGIMRQSEQVEALNHPAPGSRPLPPSEFVRRFLEVEPLDARLRFRPGDKIKATRRDLWGYVPEGAEGEVIRLEHPAHPMSLKGRHYVVRFDLTPFNIPIPQGWESPDNFLKTGAFGTLANVQINCAALDLAMVEKGDNWGEDYQFEHNLDGIQWAMEHMTPEQWESNLMDIAENINQKMRQERQTRPPGMSDKWAKEFFKNSARPPMHEFTPAEWVKLLATNPQPQDFEPLDDKTLKEIEAYLLNLPGFMNPDEESVLIYARIEMSQRENRKRAGQQSPTDSE